MGDLSHLNSVLIVEDDYLITLDLQTTLEQLGCRSTQVAPSCAQAIECVADSQFDLVTVDVKLSDGNCGRLTEQLERGGVPFVYVTGFEKAEQTPHSAPLVSKPVDENELVEAVLAVTRGTK